MSCVKHKSTLFVDSKNLRDPYNNGVDTGPTADKALLTVPEGNLKRPGSSKVELNFDLRTNCGLFHRVRFLFAL